MTTQNENIYRKIPAEDITVKQLIEMLRALPPKLQEWTITCCGCNCFWIRCSLKSKYVTIDSEEYFAADDDEE